MRVDWSIHCWSTFARCRITSGSRLTPGRSSSGPVVHGDTIRIGRVVKAHGLTGELEIRPDWPESTGLLEASQVVLEGADGERETHVVTRSRQTPKGVLMLLAGITDRTAAEARRGYTVNVPRTALPSLEEGEYYLCDLVGLEVLGGEGSLGRVVEVQMYPSVDAIVIESVTGERSEQPLLDEWVDEVDLKSGRILLKSLGGLIEVPRPKNAPGPSTAGSGER
jgi:16S rRNA processing protein RimM